MKIYHIHLLATIAMIAVGLALLIRAIKACLSVEYAGDGNLMLIDQIEAFCVFGIPSIAFFALAIACCFYSRWLALRARPK
jgi:hypothetical protein